MIEIANNGYIVQISKLNPQYWTVSRNKPNEDAFNFDNEADARIKFNELLNKDSK